MLKCKCTDSECHNYNESMSFNCNMYAWDYVEECCVPEPPKELTND